MSDTTKTLLKNIRRLERACLAKGYTPTTAATIREMGAEETERYYRWLRQQAPMTATFGLEVR